MTIALTPEQKRWLDAAVATGRFASVDEAIQVAIAGLMTSEDGGNDDWIEPLIHEARAEIARGEVITIEAFKSELADWRRGRKG